MAITKKIYARLLTFLLKVTAGTFTSLYTWIDPSGRISLELSGENIQLPS